MKRLAGVLALLTFLLLPLSAGAQEKIHLFSSRATLLADSSLEVREDITVNVEGRQIRRGIYRDFPTKYTDSSGRTVRVGFDVLETLLDGREVPFKTESIANGVRVYIGDPDEFAPLGKRTYTLSYVTTHQIGFFEGHDELYWNVTGNGWDFAIDEARFTLSIPGGTPFNSVEFYTGWQGARGQDARVLSDNSVETTAPLGPKEGLTVVYTWPKGIVTPPTIPFYIRFFEKYAFHFIVALPILLGILYALLWLRWGKDPSMPAIIPLFSASAGRTPGFLRYVRRMGMDNTCFAADILNLAVKGHLVIEELTTEQLAKRSGATGFFGSLAARMAGKTYALKRTESPAPVSPAEKALFSALFAYNKNEILLRQENHSILGKARDRVKDQYKKSGKDLFSKNTLLWLSGLLIPILGCLLLVLGQQEEIGVILGVATGTGTVAAFLLKHSVLTFKDDRGFFKKLFKKFIPALFALLIAVSLFAVFGRGMIFIPLVALANAALIVVFNELMTIRTPKGNEVLAEAEGLAMYMGTAEKRRLEMFNPPEETPEVFEALLPYAFALGVAETWANRFEDKLKEQQYEPTWYTGANLASFYTGSGIASVTSAVSSSIASASVAPGSSSGSGGGGSSGGGGGG
ncbi:MAG: DUF2207 domain-containing protein, partial [Synergistaceae bacterium]|nr:DUF2207 domain-containing protein [Synergistaceae bacterium]